MLGALECLGQRVTVFPLLVLSLMTVLENTGISREILQKSNVPALL